MCERGRSEWPCGLCRGSTAACFLGIPIRIPQGAGMSMSFECCVCCQLNISATGRSLVQGVPPSVVCLSVMQEFTEEA